MVQLTVTAGIMIPLEALKNPDGLIAELTVKNPEYETLNRFASRFKPTIPEYLYFFTPIRHPNGHRYILTPRNIDLNKHIKGEYRVIYETSGGRELPDNRSKVTFRDYQVPFMDEVYSAVSEGKHDLLTVVPCGHGKTILGLEIARRRRVNTLVVVTTRVQGTNYIKTVDDLYTGLTVSFFDGGEIPKTDIVVATYDMLSQSIGDKYRGKRLKYDDRFYENFGHVIFDEVHRIGASTYMQIADHAVCTYRTSMTATYRRKDDMHKVMRHHFGHRITMDNHFDPADVYPITVPTKVDPKEHRLIDKRATNPKMLGMYSEVVVRDAKTKEFVCSGFVVGKEADGIRVKATLGRTDLYPKSKYKFYRYGTVSLAKMYSTIVDDSVRNDSIYAITKRAYEKGRTVLLIGRRKDFLFKLYDRFITDGIKSVGVMASQKSKEQREHCKAIGRTTEENERFCIEEAKIILGIDALAQEGLDIARADTLVLAFPIADVEQPVGRIIRLYEGKKNSVVLYILDNLVPLFSKSFYEGAKPMFKRLGHRVHKEITKTDFLKRT